jgi:hypothetical protein
VLVELAAEDFLAGIFLGCVFFSFGLTINIWLTGRASLENGVE